MGLPDLLVGLPTPPRPPGGPPDLSLTSWWASRTSGWDSQYPLGHPGGTFDPFRTSGWASRPLPYLRDCIKTLPGPPDGTPASPGGPPDPSQTSWWDSRSSGWASRPLLKLRVGLPTPPGPPRLVGRPIRRCKNFSRRSWWGRNANPEVRKGSVGSPEGLEGVGRPTRRSGRGR